MIEWRRKWEKRDLNDEKYAIKSKAQFEQHFGSKASGKDEKTINFVRMYEMQADKLKKDNQLLTEKLSEFENQTGYDS